MYKLLLCWRYLRTRYIALASIISVMLGVATMIVVNSVMAGFTSEMQNRIHGIFPTWCSSRAAWKACRRRLAQWSRSARSPATQIEAMTPTVVVPAMLSFRYGGSWIDPARCS